jgi:TetR/AcrR family transcriptional regulator, transcriptional repressor for nem operon
MAPPDVASIRRPRGTSRTALLDAALQLVRRQGWNATTVDQLCDSAQVTKGAFFHHFVSKEALGVAAAAHWSEVTGARFAQAGYHKLADPLDRILGYLDLRAQIARGPLEAFTCFAGTTTQEVFATCEPLRLAAGASIFDHARKLAADFAAAIVQYRPAMDVQADDLAVYTQTVLQGGFVLSKAHGTSAPLQEAIVHLKRYLLFLFKPGART